MEGQDGVVVENGDGSGAVPPFKMPSSEELLAAIEKMAGLSDEDRQQLRDGVLRRQQGGDGVGPLPPGQVSQGGQNITVEMFMLLSMISLVFLILVFFGYKLYKSLVERERRREEKKKQKLQKKKK